MPIRVGNKADGDDFFDRTAEREDLWRYLAGNHVVLSGARRLGKTSLLQRVAEEAAERGWQARLLDVEGIDSAEAFVDQLARAFDEATLSGGRRSVGAAVTRVFASLRKVDVRVPGGAGVGLELQALAETPWRKAALALQERVSGQTQLFLIDEFSVFLDKLLARDALDGERLLGWLRAWRQQAGLACRFVFSGSIGLNALLARHHLSTRFNDCADFRLGPFKPAAALAMLAELAQREQWPVAADSLEHLCRRVGWLSPFYLNLLLDGSLQAARERLEEDRTAQRLLTTDDIDAAYDRLLANRSRFFHWFQRLARELQEPQLSFTLALLAAVARAENGLSRRQLAARLTRHEPNPDRRAERLDEALLLLEEDGYLDAGETIHFPSFLLRDYWRRNHGR
ncbi:MAG: ATP-binding protein [Candidatus Accumulibacter sp.]|uniref:ATP-binding protein n=1 Tax=Accumulibacter sp. TaxID=2053492 RepID=UPI00287972F9|nr:ATP-binding protein [Accumulibacter sp.]MDS4013192.1 ATP-binding protein [Accumulibacter sp.]